MEGDRTPRRIASTASDERDGQFSPDGSWIAFESDESGRPEVYIQPYPGPGSKIPISNGGGTQVRWRRDGRELFYIPANERLTAVAIDPRTGATGAAVALFKTQIAPVRSVSRQQYVVARDGQQFLITTTINPRTRRQLP